MNREEIILRYQLSEDLLDAYLALGFQENNREDLELWMTLKQIGFDQNEMKTYMLLFKQAERTQGCRLKMLQKQRVKLLDEIHRGQACLDKVDYLKHMLQNERQLG